MAERNSLTQVVDFCKHVESGQIVFFVGSGVSLSYPACLPSAKDLVKFTLAQHLPQASRAERETLERIWPEVLYQEIMAFLGDGALRPFAILAHPGAIPTLAHHLIVQSAAVDGIPIVTTNFDCLLEQAANRLRLSAAVVGPSGPFESSRAKLAIWKMHGSVEVGHGDTIPPDLCATVARITQPNMRLLRELKLLFTERHVCFVGYSGSDLDLFPMIKDFSGIEKPFWIDPQPSDSLRRRARSIGATLIESTLEDVFIRNALRPLTDLAASGVSLNEFQPLTDSAQKLRNEIADGLFRLGEELNHQRSLSLVQQRLLLAIALSRIGEHAAALQQLKTHRAGLNAGLDHQDRALRLVTMARLYDCLSDYRKAEVCARAALCASQSRRSETSTSKSTAVRIQSLHALAMAKKMQLGPSFAYGISEIDFAPRAGNALQVLMRYVWTAIRMKILLSGKPLDPADSKAEIWVLSAWHWYLDHKIVLIALIEAAAGRLGPFRRTADLWIQHMLVRVRRQARHRGDALVLAHVEKQLQRHGLLSEFAVGLAFDTYELATDPLNEALLYRNKGNEYLREGRISAAVAAFERSLGLATKCGSKATVLKALVGLRACGKPISKNDCDSLSQRPSGHGYRLYLNQFRRLLH